MRMYVEIDTTDSWDNARPSTTRAELLNRIRAMSMVMGAKEAAPVPAVVTRPVYVQSIQDDGRYDEERNIIVVGNGMDSASLSVPANVVRALGGFPEGERYTLKLEKS